MLRVRVLQTVAALMEGIPGSPRIISIGNLGRFRE
jgi:hypothetical protein